MRKRPTELLASLGAVVMAAVVAPAMMIDPAFCVMVPVPALSGFAIGLFGVGRPNLARRLVRVSATIAIVTACMSPMFGRIGGRTLNSGIVPRALAVMSVAFLLAAGATLITHAYARPRPESDDPSRCEECGYRLVGLREPRCPECGARIESAQNDRM